MASTGDQRQKNASSNGKEFKMGEITIDIIDDEQFSCRKLLKFIGPGFLVSVGYIDPGNCK